MTTPDSSASGPGGSSGSLDLVAALDALSAVALGAGVDESTARSEGKALAAAVLETSRPSTVHESWRALLGGSTADFFAAVSEGRRFAYGPTPVLAQLVEAGSRRALTYADALADVAAAACTVAGAPTSAGGKAVTFAGAQRAAAARVGGAAGAHGTVSPGSPGSPASSVSPGRSGGGAAWPMPTTPESPSGAPDLPQTPAADGSHLPAARIHAEDVLAQLGALTASTRDVLSRYLPGQRDDAGLGDPNAGRDPFDLSDLPPHPPTAPVTPGEPGSAPTAQAGEPPAAAKEKPAPQVPEKTVDELLAELDALIGLTSVKAEIHRQVAMLEVDALRTKAGLKSAVVTRHLVFVGNPGTGKTTVARLVGGIYHALGLLEQGQLVEVDRSELVAGYVGQTAMKTAEVCASAMGGVLFIDEAYTLAADQYGQEAVDTLVKEMEDHRNELVVIVAGYPAPMERFIDTNPGLASRFRTTIEFADYTDDEITSILLLQATNNDYDISPEAETRFREIVAATARDETFGNGRFARNTLEGAIGRHAVRVRGIENPTTEQLRTIERVDLEDRDGVDLSVSGAGDESAGAAESSGASGALEPTEPGEPNEPPQPDESSEPDGPPGPGEQEGPSETRETRE